MAGFNTMNAINAMNTMNAMNANESTPTYTALSKDQEQQVIDQAMIILARRLQAKQLIVDQESITSQYDAMKLINLHLAFDEAEQFAVMFLNNKHKLLAFETLFKGTLSSCSVHIRDVVARALQLNAAGIILCHNHPAGQPEPSCQDVTITAEILKGCNLMDIRLLDHIIVGTHCYSMHEDGELWKRIEYLATQP